MRTLDTLAWYGHYLPYVMAAIACRRALALPSPSTSDERTNDMGSASQRDARNARIPEHVQDVIEVCRAIDGKWYWHKRSSNGRIVGDSGQRFRRKWNAKRSARREANASTPPLDVIVVG